MKTLNRVGRLGTLLLLLHLSSDKCFSMLSGDPLMPVFNSCVVHNWESLECSWSPTRQKQIEHTITTQNSHTFTYDFVYAVIK